MIYSSPLVFWRICWFSVKLKKLLFIGKAYAIPFVKKNPNKDFYDIGGAVALSCHAEKTTTGYEIKWFKISGCEKPKELQSVSKRVNNMNTKILSLNSLTELEEGTYRCQVRRFRPLYSADKLVRI